MIKPQIKNTGFTLIELMIVVVIVAVLQQSLFQAMKFTSRERINQRHSQKCLKLLSV